MSGLEVNEYVDQGNAELGKCQEKMWQVFSLLSELWLYLLEMKHF